MLASHEESGPSGEIEGPEAIYRDLARDHAETAYELALLLVGDSAAAHQVLAEGFQRTWTTLSRGDLVADPPGTLYWSIIRGALRRLRRSKELRGHLPATTADDRQITAYGIVQRFTPQQQSAIFLAARAGLGYKLAGLASGVGESRARDLAFAARQEYREDRESAVGATALCHQAAPFLSARTDDAGAIAPGDVEAHTAACPVCSRTSALFAEFSDVLRAVRFPPSTQSPEQLALAQLERRGARRPTGARRLLRVAAAPLIITLSLVVGLLVFRQFGEPEVQTGTGRTSDLLYARDSTSGGTIVLDSGSGRVLARLPSGMVAPSGQRLYAAAATCQESGCTTALRVVDPATGLESAIGRANGSLALLGVDERLGRLHLADAANGGAVLLGFDGAVGEVVERVVGPDGVRDPFAARHAVLSHDGATLLTLGTLADSGQAGLLVTDLARMQVRGPLRLPGPPRDYAPLLLRPTTERVLAYHLAGGTVYEIDSAAPTVVRSAQVGAPLALTTSDGDAPGAALALGPEGTIFALAGEGGVAALSADTLAVARRLSQDQTYTSMLASTDGRLLYLVDGTGGYVVLDAASGRKLGGRNVGALVLVQVNAGE